MTPYRRLTKVKQSVTPEIRQKIGGTIIEYKKN